MISEPIKKSSAQNYEIKWQKFLLYLTSENVPLQNIEFQHVINFLTHLFHVKALKPTTIAHYRSALTLPLKLKWNIDLRVPEVNSLIRAMTLQRPKSITTAPSWKLSSVLDLLEKGTEPTSEISAEIMCLRKAAFLLLLATGWRISELHACVRDEEFCNFTENSSLIIRPHASFLAKNEARKRMSFKEVKPLINKDTNTPSCLCPVAALRSYLQHTGNKQSGKLFLSPSNHDKILTVQQLGSHIRSLIKTADQSSKVKTHDVRKLAASHSFVETMVIGDLVSNFNWSSPAVFYKHYFTQAETLSRPVSLPT